MIKEYNTIIWDWNGTLLNDIAICLKAMNLLLDERNLPELTEDEYKDVFTFPVRNYYVELGFDFSLEEFEVPALKFIEYYHWFLSHADLFDEVEPLLKYLSRKGYKQYILSAMEQNSLVQSVHNLKIGHYFEGIVGIDDHFARSKVKRGGFLIESFNIDKHKTLMLGDTLHDYEVAKVLGVDCILISQGHQSVKRLAINGNKVISRLSELAAFL